jgi:chemotaxis protein CheC
LKVDINKLVKLNQLAKEGANKVAENLSHLLGINVEMKITKIDFVTLTEITGTPFFSSSLLVPPVETIST